jgi:hypothetical protein
MSSGIISHGQHSVQFMQIPKEILVHIFGFLDFKSLGTVASVCKYFEKIQKKVPLGIGSREENNRCVLDLKHKTITLLKPSDNVGSSCLLAVQCSAVPNGSFVVYIDSQKVPNAVIKDKGGVVHVVVDVRQPNDGPIDRDDTTKRAVSHLRWCRGNSTEFHEYKLISDQEPAEMRHKDLRKAVRILRDDDPIAYSDSDENFDCP